jgi:hypothetical protein
MRLMSSLPGLLVEKACVDRTPLLVRELESLVAQPCRRMIPPVAGPAEWEPLSGLQMDEWVWLVGL